MTGSVSTGICLVAALIGEAAFAQSPARGPEAFLLVTIDTLRSDRLSPPAGASNRPMPRLETLAARGALFSRAYSQTPLTVPSHTTILTGLDTRHHGVRDNLGYALSAMIPSLATILRARGFRCAAFIGGYPLAGRTDLARGFERYDDRMSRSAGGKSGPPTERRAMEVVAAAASWLATLPEGSRFFAWVHLYDPHDPYEAPPGWATLGDAPYDAEVRYADAALGRLIDAGKARGWLDRTLVVVAGDHGEMLGERGEATHGILLYESALRVPLVMVVPGGKAGSIIDRPTHLADVAPTVMALLSAPPLPRSDGASLAEALRGDGPPPPAGEFYVESIHARRRYGWSPLFAIVDWPMKYIQSPEPETYDLTSDPRETTNLLAGPAPGRLRADLARFRSERALADTEAMDAERLNALSSLGYTGGSAARGEEKALEDRPRADPKSRIAALPVLQSGMAKLAAGDLKGARGDLDAALKIDPDNVLALHNRGIVAMSGKKVKEAVSWFERAAQSDPYSDNVLNDLGLALSRLGRRREAESAYRKALQVNPGFLPARFNLALLLYRVGQRGRAREELERVRNVDPQFPGLDSVKF